MIEQLKELLQRRVKQYVSSQNAGCEKIERKKQLLADRNGEIIKAKAKGKIDQQVENDNFTDVFYRVHLSYFIKQYNHYYIEEEVEHRIARFYKDSLMSDDEEEINWESGTIPNLSATSESDMPRISFQYDRRKAVQYAERWWNDYNPQFKKFDVDCTNFVSQCLYAGGAPMRGYPDRTKGWWIRGNNWSYSWSVANALRLYLGTSKIGLKAKEVQDPRMLQLGDVICYDFQGDGRFDHNTIVTAKDANGMPLVNAHTYNSRLRYWSYEDSSAYTNNCQYKFYTIIDDN